MIIQNMDITGTFVVEFLRRSRQCWCARKQTRLGVTSIDPVYIEESKEEGTIKHHFVEAQTM
jgi:hypothetical protein